MIAFWEILFFCLGRLFIIFGISYLFFCYLKISFVQKYKIQKQERFAVIPAFEFKWSLASIVIQSLVFYSIFILKKEIIWISLSNYEYMISILGYFFIYDLSFYWIHRLLHRTWMYKHIHIIHHKSHNPTPWASYSFHPVEAILNLLYYYIYVLIFPTNLGLFVFLVILTDFGNLAGHLGYDFFPKGGFINPVIKWITTPTHHNLHHQYPKSNYGLYFRGWDKWFKTLNQKSTQD